MILIKKKKYNEQQTNLYYNKHITKQLYNILNKALRQSPQHL